ncbi:MAG TPA: DUF4230 domain-containing protein [Gemmatimonadales bacterium]
MSNQPRAIGHVGLIVAGLVLLVLGLLAGLWLNRSSSFLASRTRVDQSVVVEQLKTVAKLVTTEASVRDVIVYENTRYGSTKRSLVVVTGKALVGLDLQQPPRIHIDYKAKQISIGLPHAKLVGLDIQDFKIYDESRGLWNPFRPADRDTIFMLARQHLVWAARDMAVVAHAEDGARQLLTGLFAPQGFTVDVVFEPFVQESNDST